MQIYSLLSRPWKVIKKKEVKKIDNSWQLFVFIANGGGGWKFAFNIWYLTEKITVTPNHIQYRKFHPRKAFIKILLFKVALSKTFQFC